MKKSLTLTVVFSACFVLISLAQGPMLSLVGGSQSFAKGNINTEILSKVIQQKQEEVKQYVFRNTIIKEFNNSQDTDHLKNYTTYSFLYNLMDVMTSGKNKTFITKSIIQNASEFAYVYGMVLFIQQSYKVSRSVSARYNNYEISSAITTDAKARVSKNDGLQTITIPVKIKDFNLLIDLCYDILINEPTLHPGFAFSADLKNDAYLTWYDSDNIYQKVYKAASPAERANFDNLRLDVINRIKGFVSIISKFKKLQELASSTDDNVKARVKAVLDAARDINDNAFIPDLKNLITDNILTAADKTEVNELINKLEGASNTILPLMEFYNGLKKSDFRDFALTKDQYYALKYITIDFLKLAKNQFKNDVVSTVVDFLLENTLVEYMESATNLQKPEKEVTSSDKGYLYIDIEALISAVYQKFSPSDKKGKYVQLFFSIGINQGRFLKSNTLTKDDQGAPKSLGNLYYASEKIGIKYKIWNWRYTHAFSPGQNFTYYNSTQRSWLRPQPKPAISDVYLSVYASGLLYNLVNLKSNDNFNYAVVGSSLGLTFFNGLSVSMGLACPYTDNRFKSDNLFLNFGIDVPIIDYIRALTK